jgi:hypothetical protein
MAGNETELEMVRRHVRQGAAHIERQRDVLARLEGLGNVSLVAQAKQLLGEFQAIQREHESHLERLLKESDK